MVNASRHPDDEQIMHEATRHLSRQEELQLQKMMANYKLTPMTLAMKLNPNIIPSPHLNLISAAVATAIAKGNGRLIISLPPRHGKSELITKNAPIWTLENYGQKNVILCTYGSELSTDFGRKVRDLIQTNQPLLNIRVRQDASRTNNWLTQFGGAMMSVGLGGPITGRGADVLLIDDYIKEIKESLSQSHRDYIWDWFVTTAYTRLEPGGTCIIIATRWHHDDLIGRILKFFPGEWDNIVIPAIAEKDDILGRAVGEPLFPERYSLKDLEDRKKILGSFFFNALYQQRPENDVGKLTDRSWIKIVDIPPRITPKMRIARVWDLAATEDGGDWMVGSLLCYDPENDFTTILNVKRFQNSPMGVELEVKKTAMEDGPNVPIYIEQEPGSSGKLLVHNYSTVLLKGFTVEAVPANDGKLIRAQPFLAAAEAGRIGIFRAPWNELFLQEYDDFPGGDHDDQVDTCGIGYTKLTGKKLLRISWGRKQNEQTPSSHRQSAQSTNRIEDTIIMPNGKEYQLSGPQLIGTEVSRTKVSWGR